MKLSRITVVLCLGIGLLCLWGCQPKTEAKKEAVARVKEAKPGAAIKLISDSLVTMNVNDVTPFGLVLDVKESSGYLTLELSAGDGLELLDTPIKQSIQLSQDPLVQLPIKLRAVENGRYYLHIHAAINNGDSPSTRNLALIVQVGPQATAAEPTSVQLKKGSGENVKVLPAQETISNQ